jgi:photosystem II stability/assembly factor-like uncharacterized protein
MRGEKRYQNRFAGSLKALGVSAGVAILLLSYVFAGSAVAAGHTADSAVAGQWDSLFGVAFGTPGTVFVVGAKGTLIESHDAGKSWKRKQLGNPIQLYDLYSVRFAPGGEVGWIVGEGGSIFRTKDGGRTWAKIQSAVKDSLFKVAVMNPDAACAVGANGILLCTENGGSTWTVNHLMDFTFFDVAFSPQGSAWAVGEYKTVVFSSDNGKHWQVQSGGKRIFTEPPNFAVAFDPSGDGIIAALGPSIQETQDSGRSWASLPLTETRQVYAAVANQGAAATKFWIAGSEGFLVDIGDGKTSRVPTGIAADITDIGFSGDTGIAVGLGGTMVRLQKTDETWRVSLSQTSISPAKQIAASDVRGRLAAQISVRKTQSGTCSAGGMHDALGAQDVFQSLRAPQKSYFGGSGPA